MNFIGVSNEELLKGGERGGGKSKKLHNQVNTLRVCNLIMTVLFVINDYSMGSLSSDLHVLSSSCGYEHADSIRTSAVLGVVRAIS